MIYEGTNEVQAIDLLMRKVLEDGGARLEHLLKVLEEDAQRHRSDEQLQSYASILQEQIAAARAATNALVEGRAIDAEWPYRIADDYLHAMGYTLLTWAWLRTLAATAVHAASQWHVAKAATARYGIEWLTPKATFHWQRVMARDAALPWMAGEA
jgi:hypothetical protein